MPDLGEFLIIAVVALLVIPPQRLPQAARTLGQWIGRMQGYITQIRTDIDREFHLDDLRKIGEEARAGARSVETTIQGAVGEVKTGLDLMHSDVTQSLGGNTWTGGGAPTPPGIFPKRYRPRPSIDDLSRDLERLKQQLALPGGAASNVRKKLSPRARINRPRVRR